MDKVLILILLEYGLRQKEKKHLQKWLLSLNPYSTGIWSATSEKCATNCNLSLNPYSTGIWSATLNTAIPADVVF